MKQLALIKKPRKHPGGRPPNGDRAGVSHLRRAELSPRHPVLVTLKTANSVPGMRRQRTVVALKKAFRQARSRLGMRIAHYSIQGNHLHLIVECDDREALIRGMQGLAIRLAKTLNRLVRRHGNVWADRYHSHVLKTRREVANALRYVFGNFAHQVRQWGDKAARFVDPFSSAGFFVVVPADAPVAPPRTWLLRVGWKG